MSGEPDVAAAAEVMRNAFPSVPRVAVVLGSGLGSVADALEAPVEIEMAGLPGWPATGVAGHEGRFVHGRLEGAEVLLQVGRYHAYEGHPMDVVVAPVRLMAELGIEVLVITNATGGLQPGIEAGDIVVLDDVLNLSFRGPLVGPVVGDELRFPDMSSPFDSQLQELARSIASELDIPVQRGTYAGVLGPSYETAAEVRMLQRMGGDVVGMSTVPEVITAAAVGLRCLGLSLVTNKGTGLSAEPLSHDDVLSVGVASGRRLGAIVMGVVQRFEDQSVEAK